MHLEPVLRKRSHLMRTATKSNPHLLELEKARTKAMRTQSPQKEKKKKNNTPKVTPLSYCLTIM